MIFGHLDYRSYLKAILAEKMNRNPQFSLRSLALQLGIAPGMLSDVLGYRKNISLNKAVEISNRLKHKAKEEEYFLALVQLQNSKSEVQKRHALEKVKSVHPHQSASALSLDHFYSVANWVCVAIIALLATAKSGMTQEEVAKKLLVSPQEAESALEVWVRLGWVKKVRTGRFMKTSSAHLHVSSSSPNGALRLFHQSMLEKAIAALENQSNTEKFVGSETIAFDPRDLEQVSEVLEQAVSKILVIAKNGKKPTSVYHLGFQFFRMTQKEK